jgi:hypothetical protein
MAALIEEEVVALGETAVEDVGGMVEEEEDMDALKAMMLRLLTYLPQSGMP